MKKIVLAVLVLTILFPLVSAAQWKCVMATEDDTRNGPGYQVPSVAVINSKSFVTPVLRAQLPAGQPLYDDVYLRDSVSANYLVGYANATDTSGRKTEVPYALAGNYTKWVSGFDEMSLYRAYKAIGMPDSLVYVANNDPDHNILVFRLGKDSVESTDFRLKTGAIDIMGLSLDELGYVYVLNIQGTTANTSEVKVFKGPKLAAAKWSADPYTDTPVQTIDLPVGIYRGITVSPDGKQLFVSSISDRNVVKYSGSPTTGYAKASAFSFALTAADSIPGTKYIDSANMSTKWDLGKPIGMAYLKGNNLLYVSCARWLGNSRQPHNGGSGYSYSRIYTVNPNNGKVLDTLDIAKYYWTYSDTTGLAQSYTKQIFGPVHHISGYASCYDVAFDEKKNLYTQSFYSWTAEKWAYNGTLPTLTSVNDDVSVSPVSFDLSQNYPNPFNPSTTLRISLPAESHVTVTVYNLLGQTVAALLNDTRPAGSYQLSFDGSKLSSGIYFYTMKAGNFAATKKMILVR